MADVSALLMAAGKGDRLATQQLLPLVYEELRRLAAHKLALEKPGHTLQATALVHEAYLRLVATPLSDQSVLPTWDDRAHFFAAAAEAMRRILVDSARRKNRLKHGAELSRQELDESRIEAPQPQEDLLALDEALGRLAVTDPDAAQLVQLRYFAGMSIPDAAQALGISPRSADRLWAFARAWLHREMHGDAPGRCPP